MVEIIVNMFLVLIFLNKSIKILKILTVTLIKPKNNKFLSFNQTFYKIIVYDLIIMANKCRYLHRFNDVK